MSAIYDAVIDAISTRFQIDRSKVVPNASFDDLGLDSLSQVELVVVLKHKFGVEISDSDLERISRVSEIVSRLEEGGAKV